MISVFSQFSPSLKSPIFMIVIACLLRKSRYVAAVFSSLAPFLDQDPIMAAEILKSLESLRLRFQMFFTYVSRISCGSTPPAELGWVKGRDISEPTRLQLWRLKEEPARFTQDSMNMWIIWGDSASQNYLTYMNTTNVSGSCF